MRYVVGWKYASNYTQEIDDAFKPMAEPLAIQEGSSVNGARVHGNPFLDVSSVIRPMRSRDLRQNQLRMIMGEKRSVFTTLTECRGKSAAARLAVDTSDLFDGDALDDRLLDHLDARACVNPSLGVALDCRASDQNDEQDVARTIWRAPRALPVPGQPVREEQCNGE